MPTTPQNEAGWRTEPPVSEPRAAGSAPAATMVADPPDEQRVEALRFHQAVGDRFGVTHSNWPSFGTTKKPSLKSGANSSGPNASWDGVTSSVRKRMASGPGTTGFTLPFAGTALSCAT